MAEAISSYSDEIQDVSGFSCSPVENRLLKPFANLLITYCVYSVVINNYTGTIMNQCEIRYLL